MREVSEACSIVLEGIDDARGGGDATGASDFLDVVPEFAGAKEALERLPAGEQAVAELLASHLGLLPRQAR